MMKVIALLALSLALIVYSRWAGEHGVAYSLRDLPPEQHAFALDVTATGEMWLLAEYGSLGLAGVLLILSAVVYFAERAGRQSRL